MKFTIAIFLFSFVIGKCYAEDDTLIAPRSTPAKQARADFEKALVAVEQEHKDKIESIRKEYASKLDTLLKETMAGGDLDESNRIDAEKKAVQVSDPKADGAILGINNENWAALWSNKDVQALIDGKAPGLFRHEPTPTHPNQWHTHPLAPTIPLKWSRKVKLPANPKAKLCFEVAASSEIDPQVSSDNYSSRRRQSLFPVCLGNGCCAEAGIFYDSNVR